MAEATRDEPYDVVIVGAGVVGAIFAKELTEKGRSVLVLEAGAGDSFSFEGYRANLNDYYTAWIREPESPYPFNPAAPQPTVLDYFHQKFPITDSGYFVQLGPQPFSSTYARRGGGTTLHWTAHTPRWLPEDFRLRSTYGRGKDWPITYEQLEPYYEKAERELGVAASAEEQRSFGMPYPAGYHYPMLRFPSSYLDQQLDAGLRGMALLHRGKSYPVRVGGLPQARNGIPDPAYEDAPFVPDGAVGNPFVGQRCLGNASCVPICPIQAKYNAMKTMDKAMRAPTPARVVFNAVVSKVVVLEDGRVDRVEYLGRDDPKGPYERRTTRGRFYVLAAHAVENAKLLLMSGIANASGQVGRNLMDHPSFLCWGYMPRDVGAFRGPTSTSGIESLRGGDFRRDWAALRCDVDNWGWVWATGSPIPDVAAMVDEGTFGAELRAKVRQTVSRQMLLGYMCEQLPDESNRVELGSRTDALGLPRPVISYDIDDYSKESFAQARALNNRIFARLNVEPHSTYGPGGSGYYEYGGLPYNFTGAGHVAGTHCMGASRTSSVVDDHQRAWEHPNLFVAGCGSFPTIGTANPTLTAAALAFRSAEALLRQLG